MTNSDGKRTAVIACDALRIMELAAAEVYEIAAVLLGAQPEGPDYAELQLQHKERADQLARRVQDVGGTPRSVDLGWNRPHSAVLSAATIYGSESPLDALREQEAELAAAYEKASQDHGLPDALREEIFRDFVARAQATQRRLEQLCAAQGKGNANAEKRAERRVALNNSLEGVRGGAAG